MWYVAAIFILIGITLFAFSERISAWQQWTQAIFFKPLFGSLIDFDNPKIKTYYKWYVIYGAALALLIGVLIVVSKSGS
jgi:hypothetical protein